MAGTSLHLRRHGIHLDDILMHITSLHCYPIKGCRGHALPTASIDALGIADDRRLMLVDENGRFISQRESPNLATVEPVRAGRHLSLLSGGHTFEHEIDDTRDLRRVTIWGYPVDAADQGDAVAQWFGDVLNRRCRLVAFGPASSRLVDPRFSPRADAQTSFTDGYPVLGVLQESLDDLNARLDQPVPMARFRPSVVIAGAGAWSEDGWRALTLGPMTLDAVKPCARCVVTTTDQVTGARHPAQEPLRTLSTFRVLAPFGTIFGQNLVPRAAGTISVGDAVSVT